MSASFRRLAILFVATVAAGCGRMEQSSRTRPGDGAVIYQSTVMTIDPRRPTAEAVIVKNGMIVDVGPVDNLIQAYPGASFDERFLRRTLLPAFVDARLSPNSQRIIEIPCTGAILAEDILTAGDDGGSVRVIAQGAVASIVAADAAQRLYAGKDFGGLVVETRGAIAPSVAHQIIAAGAILVLSSEPPAAECAAAQAILSGAAPGAQTPLMGKIAVSLRRDDDNFLGAAAEYMLAPSLIRLSPQEALEAITIDAAMAIGADGERGSIAPGKRAAFAALDRNPMATPAEAWGAITVETVDLSGSPSP